MTSSFSFQNAAGKRKYLQWDCNATHLLKMFYIKLTIKSKIPCFANKLLKVWKSIWHFKEAVTDKTTLYLIFQRSFKKRPIVLSASLWKSRATLPISLRLWLGPSLIELIRVDRSPMLNPTGTEFQLYLSTKLLAWSGKDLRTELASNTQSSLVHVNFWSC